MMKLTALLMFTLLLAPVARGADSFSCDTLRCEYCDNPLNVDVPNPRLSWRFRSSEQNQKQSAYQIEAASTAKLLDVDQPDFWESGKVASDQCNQIPFGGKALLSAQQCFWRVRVWDKQGRPSPWSETAHWSMGLIDHQDWKASWIRADPAVQTLPIFRKSFEVEKPILRAVLYICGLGQYEARLNGSKIGNAVLEPGWTDYRKTCLYQSYDLTQQLKAGSNVIGIMLGNGMYNVQSTKGRYTKFSASLGPPQLIAELHIWFQDGTIRTIATDNFWKVTAGPITFSNTYGGEDYDARLEQTGWDSPGADESHWQNAATTNSPGGHLTGLSGSASPITVAETLKVITITHPSPEVWIYDLGQNCAMMPTLNVMGPAGASVRLTPGELLSDRGTVSQRPSGGPAYYTYTLKGGPAETWSPRFTYYGSRYVQVDGAVPAGSPNPSHLPELIDLHGDFVTSSSPLAGEFSCSNPLFNQTARIIRWSMRSNMMSVLTDCPHREKLGWLEQSHLVGPSLIYNFQIPSLLTKICRDTTDSQLESGLVPDIAPEYPIFSGGFRDSAEWGSACVLLPWQLYQWYGDTRILSGQYATMRRYVEYLGTRAKNGLLDYGLGDWYDLGPKPPGQAQLTPRSLTATAFYYRDITILAQAAKLLAKDDDAAHYTELARLVRDSFNQSLYHPDLRSYATGSQTANAIPLVFCLPPEADRAAIVDNIVKDVRDRGNGLTSGDVGYRYLLRALADGGRSDVIFDMNSRSDKPGYGMILARGATSLTEAWDARPDSSQDHFMLGHIMEWFYSDLAGIQQEPDSVGFKKIVIKPSPVGDVTSATASFESPNGTVKSSWKLDGMELTLDVIIPPNSTARVIFPPQFCKAVQHDDPNCVLNTDGSLSIGAGQFHFIGR